MTPRVIIVSEARDGQRRVVFDCSDGMGTTYGPFVQYRPAAEDAAEYAAGFAASLLAQLQAKELGDNLGEIVDA